MSTKVTIPVELEIGTIEEIGLGRLKQMWVESERDGCEYTLTSGAGLGNPLLEASIKGDGLYLCARADARQFAPLIFDALAKAARDAEAAQVAAS